MSFISYAQNFEDVMLWRVLKHIEQGFYIDVGAWSPDIDSVTRAFYERGWRGINIEPSPEFYEQLDASRSRDVNLKVAMGDTEGSMTMIFLNNTGLSTLDDAIAQHHQAAGWDASRQEVEIKTIAAIWQQHVPDGQPVHFLKVDVEGFEAVALRGNNWARYRPWVVVVEATLPLSQVESYAGWEPTLLEAGYKFAYADGLNRFYVAEEHADLLPAFEYPPNVFDEFVLSAQQQAEAKAMQAEAKAEQAEAKAEQAEAKAEQAEAKAEQAEAKAEQAEAKAEQAEAKAEQAEIHADEVKIASQIQLQELESNLHAIENSLSFRLTLPLRLINTKVHQILFFRKKLKSIFRKKILLIINLLKLNMSRRPSLKHKAKAVLSTLPSLEKKVVALLAESSRDIKGSSADLTELTPHGRKIYDELKKLRENFSKDNP